jgi:hypothetical protein
MTARSESKRSTSAPSTPTDRAPSGSDTQRENLAFKFALVSTGRRYLRRLPLRPLGRRQPTTIGIPHASGTPHDAPAASRPNPLLKIVSVRPGEVCTGT